MKFDKNWSLVLGEMLFDFFNERLPLQPKLPCNFGKNLKYVTCISTVFLNIVRKVSYLAQDVIVSEILRQFTKISPPTYGLFSIQSKSLRYIYGDAGYAFCKYESNRSSGSEEVVKCFYHI